MKVNSKFYLWAADLVAQIETYYQHPDSWGWFVALEYDIEPETTSQLKACEAFVKNYKKGRYFARYIKGQKLTDLANFFCEENDSFLKLCKILIKKN